jgi:hypothetical protein
MRFSTYDLSSIYLIFVLALTLTTHDAYDRGNESSKLISIIIFGRFIKLAITTSLSKGSFFYFYVESSSSTFMHRLREHSCRSEFNVHSPKIDAVCGCRSRRGGVVENEAMTLAMKSCWT